MLKPAFHIRGRQLLVNLCSNLSHKVDRVSHNLCMHLPETLPKAIVVIAITSPTITMYRRAFMKGDVLTSVDY